MSMSQPSTSPTTSVKGQGCNRTPVVGQPQRIRYHLGPAATAVGAGQTVSEPTLVRMGEVQIYDFTGTLVFAGYAGVIDDKTDRLSVFTHVQCYDYWQQLDRIYVTEVYTGTGGHLHGQELDQQVCLLARYQPCPQ